MEKWVACVLFLVVLVGLLMMAFRRLLRRPGADWGSLAANVIDRLMRSYCRHVHHLDTPGLDLPDGPCIVVSNHVSGLDPFLLIAATDRPLRFIIAKEEYERFGLTWLFRLARCIPVDRSGRVESAFREALRALRNGEVVALFPHGKIHLDEEPDKPLKRGVFRLAELAKVPIVAARITGVRAQGSVVKAVFVPSHSRVTPLGRISFEQAGDPALRQRLGHALLGKLDAQSFQRPNGH